MSVEGYLPYSRAPADVDAQIVLNSGMLVDDFDPDTGEYGEIIGVTTGGFSFDSAPQYIDLGQNMDDVPPGTAEHLYLRGYVAHGSCTILTVKASTLPFLMAPAVAADEAEEHFIPVASLVLGDFKDLWVIGNYGRATSGDDVGYMAIKLKRAFNVRGARIKTVKNGVYQFDADFRCFYTKTDIDDMPFEIYLHTGTPIDPPPPPSGGNHSPRSDGSAVWDGLGYTWSTNAEEYEE